MRVVMWTTVERGTELDGADIEGAWFWDKETARDQAEGHGHDLVPVYLDVLSIGVPRSPDDDGE